MKSPRRLLGGLALLALLLAAALVVPGARAEEGAPQKAAPATWVYDVRVVRVNPADPAVLEAAPSWQPSGPHGATTTAAWADLLAGLKARGSATILLDQRVTAVSGVQADFVQQQIRPAEHFERKDSNNETWRSGTVETGARGSLMGTPDDLRYAVDVRWEHPVARGPGPQGLATWKGTYPNFGGGETLVLSHRQQGVGGADAQAIEIYVFVTGWLVPAK